MTGAQHSGPHGPPPAILTPSGSSLLATLHPLPSHQQPVDTSKATSKATADKATTAIAATRAKAVAARVAAASKATAQATGRPQPAGATTQAARHAAGAG